MSDFPEFKRHGYQIDRELGRNSLGGRLTYQAKHLETGQSVVIKQFQFATSESSWAEFEAYEQEIKMLRRLQHPRIPRYLDSFPMADGFCMVQEYLNAESLAISRSWTPQQVKDIAISVLKILVYLQSQQPSIIHRDIKPENILIDEEMNVYLVDFGFARMGGGEIAASSVVKGTMGFMPPEQLFNRRLTEASDLYGLGATLICLLTGTKSVEIGNLIDADYRIHFRHLVPPLKRGWINWLEKMAEPKMNDRYSHAAAALAALESIDVERLPRVRLNPTKLEFTAEYYGQQITQIIRVDNPVPNTLLAGHWEVAPHPNDPPHTPYDHAWISFDPIKFESNQIDLEIRVDTSPLLMDEVYARQVVLHSNSSPETYSIDIQVKTAVMTRSKLWKLSEFSIWRSIFILLFVALGWGLSSIFYSGSVSFLTYWLLSPIVSAAIVLETQETWKIDRPAHFLRKSVFFSVIIAFIFSYLGNLLFPDSAGWLLGGQFGAILGNFLGGKHKKDGAKISIAKSSLEFKKNKLYKDSVWHFMRSLFTVIILGALLVIAAMAFELLLGLIGIFIGVFLFMSSLYIIANVSFHIGQDLSRPIIWGQKKMGKSQSDAVQITLVAAGVGLSIGVAMRLIFGIWFSTDDEIVLNAWLAAGGALTALAATGIPFVNLAILKPRRMFDRYQRSLPNLIKP
ncbi:MAG: serine/threonine-protein kinase [Geitlerinemataceae cyanobacterium]